MSGRKAGLSFWDALIVQAALEGGCRTLLSEDMQHGCRFGELTIENPLRRIAGSRRSEGCRTPARALQASLARC